MVDPDDFKAGMQRLASGVCVIATRHAGAQSGFTATAVMSVSAEPPTLVIGIDRRNHAHDLILGSGRFSVNVLSCDQAMVADIFAGRVGLKGAERFAPDDWSVSDSGSPILRGCLASFDCELAQTVEAGTHTVAIGRVQRIELPGTGRPIVYWHRGYAEICDPALPVQETAAPHSRGNSATRKSMKARTFGESPRLCGYTA